MSIFAHSCISRRLNSFDTGLELARSIQDGFGREPLRGVVVYSTVNHDQEALVRGIREVTGQRISVVGCSSQGVMGLEQVFEEGYAAGAMGLGGESLTMCAAHVEEIPLDPEEKGRALGRRLRDHSAATPRAVVLYYDPLCGTDIERLVDGLHGETGCPIVGGAAAGFWGPMRQTFQYLDDRVLQRSAVAAALYGDFTVFTDVCDGTSPTGIEMTVTKADGRCVLEFDGRPALGVWQELCSESPERIDHSGAIGIGLPTSRSDVYRVRCAFGIDGDRSGVVFQTAIPEGSRVMFVHRTIRGTMDGTAAMGESLARRTEGRQVRAALGFECGARTQPFLGKDATLQENRSLQQRLGHTVQWLGMIAWGEVAPFAGRPGFANFTFPILLLAD